VTYLPGAKPSDAAQQALARVREVEPRESRSDGTGRSDRTGRSDGSARSDGTGRRDRKAARANNVAIHQLARRGMSRWELEQVLAKREVDERTAAAELDRLESIGLVDDAALAVSLVYAMHTRKGAGRSAIELELRRRHLDETVIGDAMAELDGDDELERATELAVARARQLRALDYEVAARRLSGYLARKGYDGDVVRGAVRQALSGHPPGSDGGGSVRFR
jgi:regulatory protein